MQTKVRLARDLFQVGAVKFGAFRLKLHETRPDAPLSPIYLNLRIPRNPKPGPLQEGLVADIAALFHILTRKLDYQLLCGVPNAGDPFAEALYDMKRERLKGLLHLGKSEEAGRRFVSSIRQGSFAPGDTVLLIDDLITRADSKLEAVEVLQAQGLKVKDAIVLVDREQGGTAELAARGIQLHAAFTLRELLDIYVEEHLIETAKRQEVLDYLAANS